MCVSVLVCVCAYSCAMFAVYSMYFLLPLLQRMGNSSCGALTLKDNLELRFVSVCVLCACVLCACVWCACVCGVLGVLGVLCVHMYL